MSNRQLLSELNKGKSRHIIKNRIKYAKLLLENNKLENIIDFDNKNDKNFLSKDSDSDASYDTRVSLKKKEHDIKNVVRSIGGELKYVKVEQPDIHLEVLILILMGHLYMNMR